MKKPSVFNLHPSNYHQLATDAYFGMSFGRIGPGLIVSRDSQGNPLSLFEHNEWHFSQYAYASTDNPNVSFSGLIKPALHNAENVELCKKLFIIRMFSPQSKSGKEIRLSTMQTNMNVFSSICRFADHADLRLKDLLESSTNLKSFIDLAPKTVIKQLKTIFSTLNKVNPEELGFMIGGSTISITNSKAKESSSTSNQTPVIPSRILWLKHNQYKDVLNDFQKNEHNLVSFITQANENPFYARGPSFSEDTKKKHKLIPERTRNNFKHSAKLFIESIKDHDLEHLAHKYKWKHVVNVAGFISLTQHCSRSLIHMFTLMRDQEALSLTTDCVEPVRGWNNEAVYVLGISTKLNSSPVVEKWITTDAVLQPINVLTSINKVIAPYVRNPILRDRLMVGVAALPISNCGEATQTQITRKWLEHKLPPIYLTEDDIVELEMIDPVRNWRADSRFKKGKPWRLTSHQFRRSIAVFAGQTGLITLPSLKRLLHHLTKVMSIYYMKGCSASNYMLKILNPKLADEMKAAKQAADAAVYVRDVLRATERLHGFHGQRIMQTRESVWRYETAEEIIHKVKRGLLAYQQTPLGGCTSTGPCDKRAHANFTTCIGCKDATIIPSRLIETIELIEWDIAELTPGTIEYKAEVRNLEDYKATYDRLATKEP